jgi:ribose transport system permease protein
VTTTPTTDPTGPVSTSGKPADSRAKAVVSALLGQNSIWILLAFIGIAIVFSVLEPEAFPTQFNWTNIAINASILLILATGQTFVIATSGIDLSVGSVLVFTSVIATMTTVHLTETFDNPDSTLAILIGLLASLAAGVLWGAFNGFLVAVAQVPPLIVTLGSMGMAMGFAQIITGGNDQRGLPHALTSTVGQGRFLDTVPYLVIIAVAVAVVAGYVMRRTRFGRFTLAIGSDAEASRRNGLPVRWHLIKVYGVAGLLAGLAGWLSIARFGATTINGHSADNLDTIAAVVLGGTSLFGGVASIFGTVVGVFIPTVLKNGFTIIGVEPFWQNVAVGAVLIAAVYYDQQRRRSRNRR